MSTMNCSSHQASRSPIHRVFEGTVFAGFSGGCGRGNEVGIGSDGNDVDEELCGRFDELIWSLYTSLSSCRKEESLCEVLSSGSFPCIAGAGADVSGADFGSGSDASCAA